MKTDTHDHKFEIGDTVPYTNSHSKIKLAKITDFKEVKPGKWWFDGIDTVTNAKVWYSLEMSSNLQDFLDENTKYLSDELQKLRIDHSRLVQQNAIAKQKYELLVETITGLIDSYWKFDENQQHMSSWHDKQDLMNRISEFLENEDERPKQELRLLPVKAVGFLKKAVTYLHTGLSAPLLAKEIDEWLRDLPAPLNKVIN
ncbi:MAG: hypothetical protein PHT07_14895 [Paludibacter sp.]|nr:hypothetical protein [Paludibacter sp.]